jgi:hypothetical protein
VRLGVVPGDRRAECTTQCGDLTSAFCTLLKPEKVGRGLPARKGAAAAAGRVVVARAAPEATPVAWRAAVVAMVAGSQEGRRGRRQGLLILMATPCGATTLERSTWTGTAGLPGLLQWLGIPLIAVYHRHTSGTAQAPDS